MNKRISAQSILLLIAVSLTTLSLFLTGCASTATKSDTAPVIDQQTLNDAAVLLRNASRNAAALAIQDNQDNRKYVVLAVAAIDTFLVGDNYTPGAFSDALKPVIEEVNDVRISLAINTVTDLYDIFYGRYVKGKLAAAANGNAALFIRNIREGAFSALQITDPSKSAVLQ